MMRSTSLSCVLVILGLLASLAHGNDDATTICSWSEFRAASIRDGLYIDGGIMIKNYPDVPGQLYFGNSSTPQSVLYTLNYSTSFDVTTSNLTNIFVQKLEGTLKQVTPMYSGYMFADAFELYTYGGLELPSVTQIPQADYAFGYELFEGTPGVVTPELGAVPVNLLDLTRYTTHGAGVNVPSENLAFYFSGMTAEPNIFDGPGTSGWTAVDQLIEVDMSTFGSPQWSNNTFGNSNILPRANAELVWVPFGTRGTLIAIGGVIDPEELFGEGLTSDQILDSERTSPLFMQNLPVYDIANSTWYLQEAKGSFPGQLTQFCSVVVNDTDTSYDIYIYGGYNGLIGPGISSQPPSDDVWVLSVPSFTWTKAYPGNGSGRRGHYCTAPYPDQMFVVGGVGTYGDNCVSPLIKIFNLNSLEWQQQYDPTVYSRPGYQRPSLVANTVKNHPTTAWSEAAIETLFSTPYKGNPIIKYWPYAPSPHHHSSSIAAIAGGVVAGCVCLIVLVLAILWYRRKHNQKTAGAGDSEVQSNEEVSRWVHGVPKTDPSVATTEIGDASEINQNTGGYYKPAEAPGDQAFNRHSVASPRPGGFAEAGGGTRRVSGGQTITPRSPQSPNTGTLGAQEVEAEERYEMEVLQSHRGSGDMGARHRFRDHPFYPLSVSDGDGRSQTSGPSYSGPSHSHSQASRGETTRDVPSPYLMARPDSRVIPSDTELPASPVRPNQFQHTRNISSISNSFPQVSPPLEQPSANAQPQQPQHARTTSEDELDALEAFHTGGASPFRPSHTRNLSSLSSGINQLPTPVEELSQEEMHRQSTLLARLSPVEGGTPVPEQRSPLLGAGNTGQERAVAGENTTPLARQGEEMDSPSSYSQGSTLVSGGRSPVNRKPVRQGLGIDRMLSGGKEGIGEERQTL